MNTEACNFDATRPVAIQLRGPDGAKTVRVRFPSDDECAERQRRRKVIVKNLGRGISETTIPNGEEIDAALLAKIRTEEEPEVDAFEAQKVIEQLLTCDVDDVVLAGDAFRVSLRVLGGTVVHLLKMTEYIDGDIVLPPGTCWVPTWMAAGTTFLGGYSITWEEIPQ